MKEKVNESNNKKVNKNIFEQYKKKAKKLSQNEKRVLALIILLIISAITFFLIIFNLIKGQEVSNEINKYTQARGVDKEHFERVRNSEEYKRMKIYTGEIIKSIVNKQYENVYNKLDKDYKEKYFNDFPIISISSSTIITSVSSTSDITIAKLSTKLLILLLFTF